MLSTCKIKTREALSLTQGSISVEKDHKNRGPCLLIDNNKRRADIHLQEYKFQIICKHLDINLSVNDADTQKKCTTVC